MDVIGLVLIGLACALYVLAAYGLGYKNEKVLDQLILYMFQYGLMLIAFKYGLVAK